MLIMTEVKAVRETNEGTELIIKINGKIKDQVLRYKDSGKIFAELRLNDGRTISNLQRKKYFATLEDIAAYTGDTIESLHNYFKLAYCYKNKVDNISMHDCSMNEAREMINLIIDFSLENDIPLSDLGLNRTDDINRYLYMCLKFRKCAITGKPNASIHHCEGSRIGMGNNRKKTSNRGRELIALHQEWHDRVHVEGEKDIFEKYKIYGIVLDDVALKSLGISDADIT